MFAVNAKGGPVIKFPSIKVQPAGGNWPEKGVLESEAVLPGTYNAWAVLVVDDKGKEVAYASPLKTVTVAGAAVAPLNYIAWGAAQPAAAGGVISANGTYSRPPPLAKQTNSIQLFAFNAKGGKVLVSDVPFGGFDETVSPFTWKTGGFTATAGVQYNAISIHTLTNVVGGVNQGEQYGTTFQQVTP